MRVLDAAEAGEVLQEAYAAGHAVRVVTGGQDKASALAAFAAGLDLPGWFGHNLDALLDALRELADDEGRVVELVWTGAGILAAADPRTYAAILRLLGEVEAERTDLRVSVLTGPAHR